VLQEFVARLPTFDQPDHNTPKTSLAKKLMTEADKAAKVGKTTLRIEQVRHPLKPPIWRIMDVHVCLYDSYQ
jgi:hypothetical protein